LSATVKARGLEPPAIDGVQDTEIELERTIAGPIRARVRL
jgi:hypothetical protein